MFARRPQAAPHRALPASALIALLALAITGCSKSVAPACRARCTCSPCSQADLDACVDKARAAQITADEKGCTDAFDLVLDCFEDTFACQTDEGPDANCSRAEKALTICTGEPGPFATACELAAEKLALCIPSFTPMPAKPCTGFSACQAQCVLAASCEDVKDQTSFDFTSCISACNSAPPPP